MLLDAETIRKELQGNVEGWPGKDLVWIEKDLMAEAIYSGVAVAVVEFNVDQGDETFKTVILFEEKKFVYVGERIS